VVIVVPRNLEISQKVDELLDGETGVGDDGSESSLRQFLVIWDRQPAMRLFLLPHDDVGTGLVIDFEPNLRESLDRLGA
jgi:hypothetical protein